MTQTCRPVHSAFEGLGKLIRDARITRARPLPCRIATEQIAGASGLIAETGDRLFARRAG